MQTLRSTFSSISSKFLLTRPNIQVIQGNRSYVRSFWAENNDYKGIPGNVRNPPKRGGYTLNNTRKVHEWENGNNFKKYKKPSMDIFSIIFSLTDQTGSASS